MPWPEETYSTLRGKFQQLGLLPEDALNIGFETCINFIDDLKSRGNPTIEDECFLQRIQLFLCVPDRLLSGRKNELQRLRVLSEIRKGNLPIVPVSNLVLQRDEVAHWAEACDLLEERVVSRRYRGGTQGVSIRVAKGVTYRVGGIRGHMVSERGMVSVSSGSLVLTSKRVIFNGDKKSFSINIPKLLGIQTRDNTVFVSDTTGKARILRIRNRANAEIVEGIVAQCVVKLE